MKTAAEIRAEISALGVSYRAIEDKAKAENREVTAEEGAEIDRLFAAKEKLDADLVEAVKIEKRRKDAATAFAGSGREPARTVGEPNPATTGGFHSIGEFASAVHAASAKSGRVVDARLGNVAGPADSHRESGSTDGYMVPPDFRDAIWNVVDNSGGVYGLLNEEPTNSNQVQMLTDETTPWGASGIEAYWGGEGSKMTASRLNTGSVDVKVHKLHVLALATDEMLSDAPRIASRIETKAGQAINWKLGEAIVYGDGIGKPNGYFGSSAMIKVAKESGQLAKSITPENLLKMYSRMLFMGGGMPLWLANSDTLPQLGALQIGDRPAWLPSEKPLAGKPQGSLLGQPLMFSQHAQTLGDEGDLQFIDLAGYAGFRRSGVKRDTSIHLYFDYDIEAFKWTIRFGGRPMLSKPVEPARGSSTKSHFVTLAARA